MKLKKLEIAGFKSFLEKASIHFPPGISAIVGPNGCGKSNVVDAMRWVMGEQSVKQLRGKSMEDVIFAGANGKAPLNMAEVNLTLANDNGSAPEEFKDFSEIQLTRRLYRSGESTYLINKHPCRLKDIHNLFMGTGMGAKTYSVIQQGNIGAITDADPLARRAFIEEAAGVTRYKNHKIEALRKIQSTNQNLLRVTDIIAEVKRQMESLKRQARRAEIYKTYQERLRELEIILAAHQYDDFSEQVAQKEAVLRELKDTDLGHTTQLKKLDAAVEAIKLQRQQKNQRIAEHKTRTFEAQRNLDRMESELAHLRTEVERLGHEIQDLGMAQVDLEGKNHGIVAEIGQAETEHAALQTEIESAGALLAGERETSLGIKGRLAAMNGELESTKARLMEIVAQEARYKNIYQNAANNRDSLKRRLKRADEEETLAARKVGETKAREGEARELLATLKIELEDLTRQIEAEKTQLAEKSGALGRQVKLAQTLDLERSRARSQHGALKKMEENFEWYKDGVRAILKRNQVEGAAPSSTLGLVAEILEPEPSLEAAVEAALGEALQYILVQDSPAGLEAIDYLQTQEAGRSGFIPVTAVKAFGPHRPDPPSPADLLLNHVAVRPGFEQVAQALLGHVVLAADLEEACRLWARNGSLQTIVTPAGHVVSHQGFLVGGSPDKLSGILAKKQELKKLGRQVARLDQELTTARAQQETLETEVRRIESSLQKRIEHKNGIGHNEIEGEKNLVKASEERKHAERMLEIVRLEQEQLQGEENDIDAQIVTYSKALKELENEVRSTQERVTSTSARIQSVAAQMESANQRVIDLQLKCTALEARFENSTNSLKRLKAFQIEGAQRIEQLAGEIRQKTQKRAAAADKITTDEQKLARLYSEQKDLEETLEHNERAFQALDARLKENDDDKSRLLSLREKTTENIRLIELEASQQRLQRENIAQRIEERYRSPLPALKAQMREVLANNRKGMPEIEQALTACRKKIERVGEVNLGAIAEYEQLKTRFEFLTSQRDDLIKAIDDLHKVIRKINRITQERFTQTFDQINDKLNEVFPRLFEGGTAKLVLTEPDKPLETGVEFMIHPPGKKLTRLSLLSGGEKALAAIAFIFSIFLIKPAAFCLMDEIDAPLDDANVHRFNDLLKIIGQKSQVIMITHNKRSMEFADMLFGITMEKKGISKVVSVNLQRKEG